MLSERRKLLNLFDKLPENFFSVLSRKYKAVYAFALVTLYQTLRTYKTQIKRADYINELRSHGEEIMSLFDVKLDKLDDKTSEDEIEFEYDDTSLYAKTNYIFKKLLASGWFTLERDVKTNIEYIYLPSYSIRMLELINSLTSDTNLYIPLVHQTFSELSLEDEKEDDYMFRSLVSARKNADELELNVTLLHHSICVFGHSLDTVFSPNEVLKQHFDIYRSEVADKVYHPMKTYDSLGLYAIPTMNILKRWLRDKRIMAKLTSQAKLDSSYAKKKSSEVNEAVYKMIQETIDIFAKLSDAFNDIDKANAKYTESVQKKVNFLSNSDKTIKGKLDAVILAMARAIASSSLREASQDYEGIEIISKASDTINIFHHGYIDSDSLTLPFKRKLRENLDPLPLEDEYYGDDSLMTEFLDKEVSSFSKEAIDDFFIRNFKDKKEITTKDIAIEDIDSLVIYILGVVRAEFDEMFFTITKLSDEIENGKYMMPEYKFVRKRG